MFSRLRYEFALRRLQRGKRRTERLYATKEAEIKDKKNNLIELQKLGEEQIHETQVIHDQIARLQTVFLREEAERYLLPIPKFDDGDGGSWEFAATAAHYQLKPDAIAELRSAIRKEKKERREGWQSWAALAIGFVGAMIGLVAALKK
jgi:hypothetical protein